MVLLTLHVVYVAQGVSGSNWSVSSSPVILTSQDGLSGIGRGRTGNFPWWEVVIHDNVQSILVKRLHLNHRDSTVVGKEVEEGEEEKEGPD